MRQFVGKIPTRDRNVVEEVYISEQVRCRECQKTVPMGIEVIRFQKDGESEKILRHSWFCRAHGSNYEARAQAAGY